MREENTTVSLKNRMNELIKADLMERH